VKPHQKNLRLGVVRGKSRCTTVLIHMAKVHEFMGVATTRLGRGGTALV
jgi:hypothetical protein